LPACQVFCRGLLLRAARGGGAFCSGCGFSVLPAFYAAAAFIESCGTGRAPAVCPVIGRKKG